MRKIIIAIISFIVLSSFSACHRNMEPGDDTESITQDIENTEDRACISDDYNKADDVASASDEQHFFANSEDDNIIINVTTINDFFENRIKEITVINNGVTLNKIEDIIGYYDSVTIDTDSSLALITYHGRKWIDFTLLDITDGQIVYRDPFDLEDIKTIFQKNGMMNYEINDNDMIAFYCDKILDNDSIKVSFRVHDTNDNLQGGSFDYIISKHEFKDLQDNARSIQSQIEIIADNIELWAISMDYANDQYSYAVTDLDNNKRLEVIASNIGGTGIYTYSSFYEINEGFDGLIRCESDFIEGDSEADIAVYSILGYYDADTDIMYYIFDDLLKNGAAEYNENKRAIYLDNGIIMEIPLAYKSTIYTHSKAEIIYQDADQNEISEADYNMAADKVFADLEKKSVSFGWCRYLGADGSDSLKSISRGGLIDMLMKSYEDFTVD